MFDDKELHTQGHLFYLMNKDTCILKFEISGEGALEDLYIVEQYRQLPFWISDAADFIRNRRAPKKRENIARLLELSGCNTLLGYFSITHALSLIDTFWAKEVGSDLTWDRVSLFTHEFNEVIAKTAFEGGLHGYNLSTTSPEYGTDGTFAKCWIREMGQIKLLKRGSFGARNAGLEPYSEYYISQIARALGLHSVEYGLRFRADRVCSVCDIFTSERYGYVPYAAVELAKGASLMPVIRYYASIGLEQEIRDMFVFDAVVFNEDRHKGNFGFIVDNEKQEIVEMAPLFDHNIALLCYAEQEDFEHLEEYLKQKGPTIGDDFVKDAAALLTPHMRKRLIQLKGFQFERHPKYNLPEWRLEALEAAVNRQIELILE